jgi:hypothetical protein
MPFDIDNRDSDFRISHEPEPDSASYRDADYRISLTPVQIADASVPRPLRRTLVASLDRTLPSPAIFTRILGFRRYGGLVTECDRWCCESEGQDQSGEHGK